jgi:hypothetical protein
MSNADGGAPGASPDELSDEDLKLVTLARGARARIDAAQGAAVRDETGRTYSGATVSLKSMPLSALALAVAQAVAAGARGLEAVALVSELDPSPADVSCAVELGGEALPIIVTGLDGSVRAVLRPGSTA